MSNELKTMKAAIYCRTNTPDPTGSDSQKATAMQIVIADRIRESGVFLIIDDVIKNPPQGELLL